MGYPYDLEAMVELFLDGVNTMVNDVVREGDKEANADLAAHLHTSEERIKMKLQNWQGRLNHVAFRGRKP